MYVSKVTAYIYVLIKGEMILYNLSQHAQNDE